MTIEHEEAVRLAAKKLHSWMASQTIGTEALLHAAVCCDYVGHARFENALAEQLAALIAEVRKQDLQIGHDLVPTTVRTEYGRGYARGLFDYRKAIRARLEEGKNG